MPVHRVAGGTSLIDVLDRVLDKGIVIDAHVRLTLAGIDLITIDDRLAVGSIDTYLSYGEAVEASSSHADKWLNTLEEIEELERAERERHKSGRSTRGEPTEGSGSGGAPAFAGSADLLPRAQASRQRKPID